MSRYVSGILMAALGVALSSTPAAAQFSSNVQGIVADQSGAVMPGVTVTARNLDTQVAVNAVTNETGVYRLSSLAPGRYEVTAEISGFQPAKTEVRLETAQTAGVNLTLTSQAPASRCQCLVRAQRCSTLRRRVCRRRFAPRRCRSCRCRAATFSAWWHSV